MKAYRITFGGLLRALRHLEGKGVRQAASEAGVSAATFSRVERGATPDLRSFRLLAKWLELDAAWCLELFDASA